MSSNRLPVLLDRIREAHKATGRHALLAAEQALAAGEMLVEAKSLCAHGEWGDWLLKSEVPARSAQRYMSLFRGGLKPAIVADLGMAVAERYSKIGLKLIPPFGKAVYAVGREDYDELLIGFISYWWREDDGFGYWHCTMAGDRSLYHSSEQAMPIWYLGFLEGERSRQFDLYNKEEIPLSEAREFIDNFEHEAAE